MTEDALDNIATLRSCALVCHDWRVRSQRMLFYKIQLSDTISFHRLSTILDDDHRLRGYVYQVELTGHHLHYTTSIFALFPVVFAGKLPNLEQVDVVHFSETEETRFPKAVIFSFTEFARMLHGLPTLEKLACISVRWITPGGSHPGADFTKPHDWTAGRHSFPPFAPKLRKLTFHDVALYGVERMIFGRADLI
ncbi:hypothetical protein V8D89_001288 [Ganoderma adspersum]